MEKVIFRTLKPRFTNFLVIKRTFYDYPGSGYSELQDEKSEDLSWLQRMRKASKKFKGECKLFVKEIQDEIRPLDIIANEIYTIWKFRETEEPLNQWIVNCDKNYDYGYSVAKLELSTLGTGIFHGILDMRVPKDGMTTDCGYCNITTVPKLKSFQRSDLYNWTKYNELILRVRGDGRTYMINILPQLNYNIIRYIGFHYFIYTRGGPYWQTIRIPFAKFFVGSKGHVYENQFPVVVSYVQSFGITLADKKSGPFRLEIDYIGVCNNTNLTETFAYENYEVNRKVLYK